VPPDAPLVLGAYLALSLVAFLAYGLDKRAARAGARRIPERTLHLLALAGGFAGAHLGRRKFRHKTREPAFGAVILVAAVLHVGYWVWRLAA
jgi:uncharacterized membrane protein YsdA (DUF1294 family)